MSEPARHIPPFFCPYCAAEDIRPSDAGRGAWACAECRRAWRLTFLGIATERPETDATGRQ